MRNRIDGFVVACWIVGCVGVTLAADPPIYVTEPLTITQPGSYILSRDIEIDPETAEPALVVTASNVEIDLAGFQVKGNISTGDPAILISGNDIRLHNGSVRGNREDPPAIRVVGSHDLVLEDLFLDSGGGVELDGIHGFRLENLTIVHGFNTAIYGWGSQGSIVNNDAYHIGGWGGAMFFHGDSILVRSNVFSYAQDGLVVSGSQIAVADNRLVEPFWTGMELENCFECSLRRNFVSETIGVCFRFSGDDGSIDGNECSKGESGGLWVEGTRNSIRNNLMLGAGWGVAYSISGNGNRYCHNRSRDFPVDRQISGEGNRPCESIEAIEQSCSSNPFSQISAIQPAGDCDQPGLNFPAN